MQRVGRFLFGVAILLTYPHLKSDEVTNREIVQTFVNYHISQKQFEEAEAKLTEHLQADPQDPERWNVLALVYMEIKKYPEAEKAFEEAEKNAPAEVKAIYIYNHAIALAKIGRKAKVEELLRKAAEDEHVRDSARAALEAIKNKQEPPPLRLIQPGTWNFSTTLMTGYDSNVQLIAINSLDSISRSDTASYVVTPAVRGGFKKEFYNGLFDVSSTASYSHYFNSETSKYNSIVGGLQGRWIPGYGQNRFTWGMNAKFGIVYLNSDGYKFFNWNQSFGLEAEWQHSKKSKTLFELPIRLQRYDETGDSNNFRTGLAVGFKANHRFRLRTSQASIGVELERVWTKGPNYKSYQYTVPVTWARGFKGNWIATAALRAGQVYYNESATDREDITINPTLGLNKILSSAFTTGISYAYTRNQSTVDSASYQKHNLLLIGNYEF